MMRQKLLYRIDGCVWSRTLTEVCDATSHMIIEVGGGASHMN